jgi:hypothetical protein
MPDDALFALADDNTLLRPEVMEAQLDRMLADPRSAAFDENFAGQWLGIRELGTHQSDLPGFDPQLRASMQSELFQYFDEFLRGDRPFDQFLSADVNFVDARLARHYGMDTAGLGDTPVRVEDPHDERKGFFELAGVLTTHAFEDTTSPWERGYVLAYKYFCAPLSELPISHESADFPDPTPETAAVSVTIAQTDGVSVCNECHAAFDRLGLAFEDFDALGRFRATYPQGDPVASAGVLADGSRYADPLQLADLLGRDPRFLTCAASKLLTYALGRGLGPTDQPYVERLRATWDGSGLTLHALMKLIALDDTFLLRRGEANP